MTLERRREMRSDLDKISKKVQLLRERARALNVPRLILIDLATWTDNEQRAYATADEDTRDCMIDAKYGPLPARPDRPGFGIIVVCETIHNANDNE